MEDIKNIETKVAEAILQMPEDFVIGSKTYKVAPPSVATLILASEAVSHLPSINFDTEHPMEECLSFGKDCKPLGDIAAILILGARNITETVTERQEVRKKRLWGLWHTTEIVETERVIDRKSELSQELIETLSPRELHNMIARLLQKMQIADFFALTTFLIEINLLRQTKVEEN